MENESFYKLINDVIIDLSKLTLGNDEYICVVRSFDKKKIFPGLTWLSEQVCYPQFYWYHRTGNKEVSLLGVINLFDCIKDVEFFLLKNFKYSNLRIWILNSWDYINNHISFTTKKKFKFYFLPRLEIFRSYSDITFSININGKNDIQNAIKFLRKLKTSFSAINKLNVNILTQEYIPNYSEWCFLFKKAIANIKSGNIKKVVIARKTKLVLSNSISVSEFLLASKKINHNCYHFMIAFSKNSGFVSSTPERLYLRKGVKLFSEALAGTMVNNNLIKNKQSKLLLKDKKNQFENLIVVDDICNQLTGFVSKLYVSRVKIVQLYNIQHLCRYISATLIKPSDSECLRRLHPTAAICGFPRKNAYQFLLKNELFNRNLYGGVSGYISLNESEFIVSIRCAQINKSCISLYSGAGIVSYSNPYDEWKEVQDKIIGLKSIFNINK